jgi:hypothetical protein
MSTRLSTLHTYLEGGQPWGSCRSWCTAHPSPPRWRVLCEDRDNWGRYFNVVFFDSYEAAMANSALPEAEALSERLKALADGPPTFYNLDVVDDRE